jgi:hypothetical protein
MIREYRKGVNAADLVLFKIFTCHKKRKVLNLIKISDRGNFMKKLVFVFLVAIVALGLIGCDKAVEDPNYRYRTTGHFADWGSNFEERFMMENVSRSDARIKDVKGALKDAQYIYLWEYNSAAVAPAGWTVDYSGKGISQDGRFAVKFIRLAKDDFETSGWAFDMWIPSTEAGGVKNLSPDTIYVPMDRSDEAANAANDGLGSNNGNPVLLKGAQTYYIVFAVFKDRSRGVGAVVKP